MDSPLRKTPLYEIQKAMGARFAPFAGWDLPIQFSGIIDEHKRTRTYASLFDISHMGEFEISGPGTRDFLQNVMTNDLDRLSPGKCFYTLMCNENGGTIDDSFLYRLEEERFFLVVNAANIEKDLNWLKSHKASWDVTVKDRSDSIAKLDLQGPASEAILKKVYPRLTLKRFEFQLIPEPWLLVSRTGYTGEDGFELYMKTGAVVEVWNTLLEAGNDEGIAPGGLGARDSLRIESCYSLYGHELDEETTPVEAGIGWVVRDKKASFPGKEHLLKQKKEGIKKNLVAFEMEERALPREGFKIFYGDKESGKVTSGTFSPTLEKAIGLGYIENDSPREGEKIKIEIRNKLYQGTIVKKPFYQYMGGK